MIVGHKHFDGRGHFRPDRLLAAAGYVPWRYRLLVEEDTGKVRLLGDDARLTCPDSTIKQVHLVLR